MLHNNLSIQDFKLSLEMIDFQPKDFGQELEAIFQAMMNEKILNTKEDAVYKKRFNEVIKKHTNLNIDVITDTDQYPCAIIGIYKNQHILGKTKNYKEENSKTFVEWLRNREVSRVNIKQAKVYGEYSENLWPILFSRKVFYHRGVTAAGCTAVLLHEIGHIFTAIEYLDRVSTANQVLQALIKTKDKSNVEEYSFLVKTAQEVLNPSGKKLLEVNKNSNDAYVATVVVNETVESIKSQTGSENYDCIASEQLADAFAARFGYGKDLILFMEAVYGSSAILEKSKTLRITTFVLDLVCNVASIGLSGLFFGPIGVLFQGLLLGTLLVKTTPPLSNIQPTYDGARVRYLRVREQIIENLKKSKLSKQEVQNTINDLKKINKIVATYNSKEYEGLYRKIGYYLFPSDKKIRDYKDLQRDLEELANNDLFVKARELSLLKV